MRRARFQRSPPGGADFLASIGIGLRVSIITTPGSFGFDIRFAGYRRGGVSKIETMNGRDKNRRDNNNRDNNSGDDRRRSLRVR